MSTSHNLRLLSRRLVVTSGLAALTFHSVERVLAQSDAGTPEATPGATPMASDAPAGAAFAWLLGVLNNGGELSEATVSEQFTDEFLSDVPPPDVIALFEQLGATGPYSVESYEEASDGLEASAVIVDANGERVAVSLAVTEDTPPLITGLGFQPAGADVSSWEELDEAWSALAGSASFLAAEVVDGECVPIHTLNPEERLAIGSVFKLYILGALADQVRDGTIGWDDPLAIRDEWKAAFSAPMSAIPAGEERTLREFANEMISVSDNTATDHLLFHLGRENVEAMQAEMGHGAPELNQPMLSAQELFQLKLGAPPELLEAYLAAPEAERRELLGNEVAQIELGPLAANWWQEPILIDQLEWFASVEDICHAIATLHVWSTEPGLEPTADILSINPGLGFDPEVWPYIGFKGGSELGVLSMNWLLGHADGRTFVVSATVNDTEAPLDEPAAYALLEATAQLLADSI